MIPSALPQEKEVTFYNDNQGVRITNTRLLVPEQMFVMANITSVKRTTIKPSYAAPIIFVLAGLFFAIGGFGNQTSGIGVFGLLLLIAGGCWWVSLRPTYRLDICSSSGEKPVLQHKNAEYIDKLVVAIHEAIIHRG